MKIDQNRPKMHGFHDFHEFFKVSSKKNKLKKSNEIFSSGTIDFLASRKRVLTGGTSPRALSLVR